MFIPFGISLLLVVNYLPPTSAGNIQNFSILKVISVIDVSLTQ